MSKQTRQDTLNEIKELLSADPNIPQKQYYNLADWVKIYMRRRNLEYEPFFKNTKDLE